MNFKEITTLAAVFAALGMEQSVTPDVSSWPERYHAHKEHEFNVQMAIDAINGPEWVADWNNTDQRKYEIWWNIIEKPERASGRGLSFYAVGYDYSGTYVGPRLVFENREKAKHFADHFLEVYRVLLPGIIPHNIDHPKPQIMYKKIKTIAGAYKALGIAAEFVPNVKMWPAEMRAHKIIEFQLQMVVLAINGAWTPDWNNTEQYKYYSWWRIIEDKKRASGRGLSFDGVDCDTSYTIVGPRLVFESREKAEYARVQFKKLYEAYYLGEGK